MQITSGMLGGMGGCGMVGQSLINVNAGGSTRVAGLTCGAALLTFILFGSAVIQRIPMAALTGVMLILVIDIFDFTSFARLNQVPRTDAVVLVTVTAVTYATNLAVAVVSGVIIASLSFAWQSAVRGVSAVQVRCLPSCFRDHAHLSVPGVTFTACTVLPLESTCVSFRALLATSAKVRCQRWITSSRC